MHEIADNPSLAYDWLNSNAIADALATTGYCVLPAWLPDRLSSALLTVLETNAASLREATIGRGEAQRHNRFVRRDKIAWLDEADARLQEWFALMRTLRGELNRLLFMGLWDFECHLAHYAPGDFYKRHVDAFRGRSNRRVSLVAYLNRGWLPEHGGELVLYCDPKKDSDSVLRVTPVLGTVVIFLSEDIPHEVLPAQRDRYSVAGWFRINDTLNNRIDPSH
jgi:SM-20-related protein